MRLIVAFLFLFNQENLYLIHRNSDSFYDIYDTITEHNQSTMALRCQLTLQHFLSIFAIFFLPFTDFLLPFTIFLLPFKVFFFTSVQSFFKLLSEFFYFSLEVFLLPFRVFFYFPSPFFSPCQSFLHILRAF